MIRLNNYQLPEFIDNPTIEQVVDTIKQLKRGNNTHIIIDLYEGENPARAFLREDICLTRTMHEKFEVHHCVILEDGFRESWHLINAFGNLIIDRATTIQVVMHFLNHGGRDPKLEWVKT